MTSIEDITFKFDHYRCVDKQQSLVSNYQSQVQQVFQFMQQQMVKTVEGVMLWDCR